MNRDSRSLIQKPEIAVLPGCIATDDRQTAEDRKAVIGGVFLLASFCVLCLQMAI